MNPFISAITTLLVLCSIGCTCGVRQPRSPFDGGPRFAADAIKSVDANQAMDLGQTPPSKVCGICYAHNWQNGGVKGYGSDTSLGSLDDLQKMGIRAVSLTPFGWMKSLTSTEVHFNRNMRAGENWQRLIADAKFAKQRGMTVMLKPHIWIGNGEWRGKIAPDPSHGGWEAWKKSYEAFALDYAKLAKEINADWYTVGVELVSAVRENPGWMAALVAKIRQVYKGKLTYCANWADANAPDFWPHLDAIGIQMFAPLRKNDEMANEKTLMQGALARLASYEDLAKAHQKPLLITEVGYKNVEGTTAKPWAWPEHGSFEQTHAGDEEQALAYQVIIKTFGTSPHVDGLYWWKWFTDPNTTEEGPVGFSPRGKPAEKTLQNHCER